jgi:uncharacterized protein YgiM (DUF1202 family)
MTDELKRQVSEATTTSASTIEPVSGSGMRDDSGVMYGGCSQPMPETIEIEQVLGAQSHQLVVEFDMLVPDGKPDIHQVIDAYVKDVEIMDVDVIPDKVIIRGIMEVKVMYVANLPDKPVHAVEKRHVNYTQYVDLPGAEPDMNATADVEVEFIDYDFDCWHDDRRKVHVVIVLNLWARVTATTAMDVIAMTPIDQVGQGESVAANIADINDVSGNGYSVSASQTGGGNIAGSSGYGGYGGYSAENMPIAGGAGYPGYGGYSLENVSVTGIQPVAGTSQGTAIGTAKVTGNKVNVRTGPGTTFPVVTQVKRNATVTITDSAFGWNHVVLADGSTTGWIASWLLQTTGSGTVPFTPNGY